MARNGFTQTYPAEVLHDREKLKAAIRSAAESAHLGSGDHLGGWTHEGKLWLDPVDIVKDEKTAGELGRKRDQIAIYDLAHGREIPTGGSGGGRITEHDASGKVLRSYSPHPGAPAVAGGV